MRGFIRRILASCLIFLMVWCGGLYWFVAQIPVLPSIPPHADAIVVLTGGAGRLELGLNLLMDGKATKLFVSGANQQVSYDDIVRLAPVNYRDAISNMAGWKIVLGNNAENTIGNAAETEAWLEKEHYKHIILVTSNYHMPRSLSEFHQTMPYLAISPVAVIPSEVGDFFWWLDSNYRPLVLSEYYKYIIGKLRHWALDNFFDRA